MPRPPSKHGLERKFKPWRRGKSKAAKPQTGSLKHQLRGVERLWKKVLAQQQDPDDTATEEVKSSLERRRVELEARVAQLKQEIQVKEAVEKERRHARESHGKRFLERQRLTRFERAMRKLMSQSTITADEKECFEQELYRIALDQVYVAHYPHDSKYLPLFRNGVRVQDENRRILTKRSLIRQRILENLASGEIQRVQWIARDQYDRIPNEWAVSLEESTFAKWSEGSVASASRTAVQDNRFALSQEHVALVDVAEKLEQEQEESVAGQESAGGSANDESSSEDNDSRDSVGRAVVPAADDDSVSSSSDGSSSSSDSDSTSDSSDNHLDDGQSERQRKRSIDTDQRDESRKPNLPLPTIVNDEFGDFFTTTEQDNVDPFAKAKPDKPEDLHAKGDKSQGWATQRQRPGQFKKRRTRT